MHDLLKLGNCRREAVVKGGIVNEFSQRAFAAFGKGQNAVGALQQASNFSSVFCWHAPPD
jgi:hypothetical protein